MRRRLLLLLPLLAGVIALPATAGPRPAVTRSVAPGYDLFATPDGSQFGVDAAIGGVPVMTFKGVPLRTFDFAGIGTRVVGETDTIVRRFGTATPASPKVDIELVGLLLESTNVRGYYVTLQSARPLGERSMGTLEFRFDRAGLGGLLTSRLTVNYDIRYGAPDGPIVYTGSTGMDFTARDLLWTRSAPDDDSAPACVHLDGGAATSAGAQYCTDTERLCHDARIQNIRHLHCVEGVSVLIAKVNHLLNGGDTAADFHPVGTATKRR